MSTELYQSTLIKNIGIRPHNLPLSSVEYLIKQIPKGFETGILVIKPGCFSKNAPRPAIQDEIEGLVTSSCLDVLATSYVCLGRQQVHDLYPDIFGSQVVATSDRLAELRIALECYMSNYVFSYLISGEQALKKLNIIKGAIRRSSGYIKGSINVHNIVHVPDESTIPKDIGILFSSKHRDVYPKL